MSAASFQLYVMLRGSAASHDGSNISIQRLETTQGVNGDMLMRFSGIHQEWLSSYDKIEFSPSYRTVHGESLFIKNYDMPKKITDTLTKRQQFTEYVVSKAKKSRLTLKAFLGVHKRTDGSSAYYFQIIDQRHLLDKGSKWYPIVYMNNKYSRFSDEALTIGDHLSIIYDTRDKKLNFRSFRDASLLLDLSSAFKVATEHDIKSILSCNKVKSTPAEIKRIIELCDDQMRKKFAIIQYEGILDNPNINVQDAIKKAKEFGIIIKAKGSGNSAKIVFPQEKETLKLFLRFLCQDFYESILTGDKCISNSHRKI